MGHDTYAQINLVSGVEAFIYIGIVHMLTILFKRVHVRGSIFSQTNCYTIDSEIINRLIYISVDVRSCSRFGQFSLGVANMNHKYIQSISTGKL